jgi:hypothetical protein
VLPRAKSADCPLVLAGMNASVTKNRLAAASLVVALPAAFLAYLLVMAFLQKPGFNEMKGFFQIISIVTLATLAFVVAMPFGIVIRGKSSDAPLKKTADEPPEPVEDTPADDKDGFDIEPFPEKGAAPDDEVESFDDADDAFTEGDDDEVDFDDDFDDFDDKKKRK